MMPAPDRYLAEVKKALVKDGWTITAEPYHLRWGKKDMYVDLSAERLVAAEKLGRRIAVEVKSFLGPSDMEDLEKALGQFILYEGAMATLDPGRSLFLAITEEVYVDLFEEPIGELAIERAHLRLMVIDPAEEVIRQWIL